MTRSPSPRSGHRRAPVRRRLALWAFVAAGALAPLVAAPAPAAAQPADSVELHMTPTRSVVRRAEVLNFAVRADNRTAQAFLRSDASGGVALAVSLPRGLVYREGGGRADTVSGATVALVDPDTANGTTLFLFRDADGERQGLNLGVDQAVVFRFQVVASSALPERTVIKPRVWLVNAQGERLTLDQEAEVRVEPEAELDEGLVLGRVFCDADGDGVFGGSEVGVGGVRVVADTGWVTDSDPAGALHFRKLAPGMHLFKLDAATLPPGSTPSG
ncbi:MAG: hypothetical protein KC635_11765, partial [Myxococcales bacterium]|nr:hypothetical protein [Myxococcales bacterium]